MATTITELTLSIAAEKSIRAARAKLAPLGKFATSFVAAQGEVGDTVKVPVFSRSDCAEFAAGTNDYTSASAAGVSGVSISLDKHPWNAKRLLPDDVMETNAGKDWIQQTAVCTVESVAKYVADTVLVGTMKTAGVQTLTISGATARAKIAKMRKDAVAKGINPAEATLLLPTPLYTDLLDEVPYNIIGKADAIENGELARYLGFGAVCELQDAVTYKNDNNKTVTLDAMIAANDAIGIATRLPLVQNPEKFEVSAIQLEEVGPWAFQIRSTGSAATDAKYLGAEVCFGFKVMQAGKVMVASTTEA